MDVARPDEGRGVSLSYRKSSREKKRWGLLPVRCFALPLFWEAMGPRWFNRPEGFKWKFLFLFNGFLII
jgi:hypothetical protein